MLKGKNVLLGALDHSDRDKLYEWINDRSLVLLSAAWKPVHGLNHADWFKAVLAQPGRVIFAIRASSDARLVGVVQLIDISSVHRNAEMIIRIGGLQDQSRGFGTEALQLLLEHAWRDANLHRVTTRVFADNTRAIRCYEKAGFKLEGRQTHAAFIDGKWMDILLLGAINPREEPS